ncbi:MAG: sulfotransferase [Pseudomonadota bacterium]
MEPWTLTPGLDETSRWAFIVGAPRCGTTAMSEYLRAHPEVCFSTPKEPHYFLAHDLRGKEPTELREIVRNKYLDRFFPERQRGQFFAEGSVSYFYAPERLEPIMKLWPRAKFLIAVRNPLELVPSLHQRLFYNGDENLRDFNRAWDLTPERRAGRKVPRSCLEPRFLDYWESGFLGKHLQNFFSMVDRERCLVTVFDDFKKDPGSEYRRVLEFLELGDDGQTNFERHAESKDSRIAWIHRLMKRPPRQLLWLFDSEDREVIEAGAGKPGPMLERVMEIRTRIIHWNRIMPAPKPQVSDRVRKEMRDMYREDVALLSRQLGRDLSHWIDA